MIPPDMLRDAIATLTHRPQVCVTFPADCYREDGAIFLAREGRGWLLHRYLAHVLGAPMARYMHRTCKTTGCVNPRHCTLSTSPRTGPRKTCRNGHRYTPANLVSAGHYRCRKCRDAANDRRRKGTRRRGWCNQGHKLTADNVYTWVNGQGKTGRRCKTCHLQRVREQRANARKENQ